MSTLSSNALSIVKSRLNRLDTTLDSYLAQVIEGSELELGRVGIVLQDDADDLQLLADYATWRYQSRDQPGGMPQWLSLRRRERFLSMKGREGT